MRRTGHRLLAFFLALAQRLREDRSFETAGSLTYTTLLALVPLIAVALALATPFPAFERAMDALGRFATARLLPEGGAEVTQQIAAFAERAGELTSVGLAFLVVTSLLLMSTVDEALNRIFRCSGAIHGSQVDDVARGHIKERGYGEYFLHRTGHSIGYEVHGNGVNIDNLETRDQRRIVPGICFSIEPGVYLPEIGVRSEIDMFIGEAHAEVTGDIQHELRLLA